MNRTLRIALGLSIVIGCYAPEKYIRIGEYDPTDPSGPASEAERACIENPATHQYLQTVHARLVEAWDLGFGSRFRQVISRISLDADGNVTEILIVQSPNNRFSQLAISIIENAEPFDPIPNDARCLTERPLTLVFRVDHR